ncbi:DUF447 domain-containing protein [Methylocella silvestris]|uniref:Tetrahydromethanopterin synthesis protein n=1 Tax=Methylocella silvestris TaxID=199596 RepID=A0A2J7TH81_METSI|nr:DUF447 domain-containing protein [Methylocella silvestris]PNG26121.1 tetrahydromethanopterin synthesis protein [Methylocella silvestris]
MIREVVVTTMNVSGAPHLAPLGAIADGEGWILAPFRPSTTLDNLKAVPFAVANYIDDARVFAGLVTGRRDWPLQKTIEGRPPRLAGALAHAQLTVIDVEDHIQRPRFRCRVASVETHAPFEGLNRAKNAVLEGAVLITRLNMLPREKIDGELAYLSIAIEKTAGPDEREAWSWLIAARDRFYAEN